MHRIDTPTAQKDKFGAGKNGFTRGNPQTGTPAKDLDDDYFDAIQEELAGVVEATGVSLDKAKRNQLLTALKALLLSRAHPFADIKADGVAAVAEALANLGIKGGALLDVGSAAEVVAGTANKLVNIPALTAFFDLSATALNGSIRIPDRPGGIIFAWGSVPAGSGGVFTRAFTSSPFVIALPNSSVGGGISADTFYVNATSTTGFTTIDQTLPRKYIAIGK